MIDVPTKKEEELRRSQAILGSAISAWSQIEAQSGELFQILTKMGQPQSDAIFFSARSFNCQLDMLRAATQFSNLDEEKISTTIAFIKKLSSYYQSRNKLAHSWISYICYKDGDGLTEPRIELRNHFHMPHDKIVCIDEIATIEINFKRLALLFACHCELLTGDYLDKFSLYSQMRPGNIHEELDAIPNEADGTQLSQKQKGRERQRLAALRSKARRQSDE